MRAKTIALLVVLALVVGGWTIAWMQIRDAVVANLDRGLEDLAAGGVVVTCPDRTVGGWPFRVTVTCEEPDVRLPDGTMLTAARLESNGTINDPSLIVSRLASPVRFEGPGGETVTARFDRLVSSFRPGPQGSAVPEVSVAADGLILEIGLQGTTSGELRAVHAEAHVRPAPSNGDDVEVVTTFAEAVATFAGRGFLPAPADAGVQMTVRKAPLLDGSPNGVKAWASEGGAIDLTQAALEIGETRIELAGQGGVGPEGYPTADLTATATGIDWLTGQASGAQPLNPALAALGSAFLLIGKRIDGEGSPRRLDIQVGDGAITANGLPLGGAPRLF